MIHLVESHQCFSGNVMRYRHASSSLQCDMHFSVFLPPAAESGPVPVLYWLSGLTCTDVHLLHKGQATRLAAQLGIALVAPDTSPRGETVADDPEGAYDFGLGASFYVDATQAPFAQHYQMYRYVTGELPTLVEWHLPVTDKRSISGHSMGGHGALMIALRNPTCYCSVSAFAPISSPMRCPWGKKAFSGYLGDDENQWQAYDSTHLLRHYQHPDVAPPALIDQGDADEFLKEQLQPHLLLAAAQANQYPLQLRMRSGYDHSYYFIASFIDEHLTFHAHHLLAPE